MTPSRAATGTATAIVATSGATHTATVAPPTAPAWSTPAPGMQASDNPFVFILGPVSAPEGWGVQPCEGDGPFLCVTDGEENAGGGELSLYPIETLPEFQAMLAEAGIEPGPLDFEDPAQGTRLLEALQAFVANYHESIETDRQVEYGDRVHYSRLDTEEVMVGRMPGLRFGFAGLEADGNVYERWVTYAAYDGDLLHILAVFYRPDAFGTFRSDEALQQFLPYLDPLVAGLHLPLPVLETEVDSVRALRDLEIFRTYGMPGNPAGQVAEGEIVTVTGISPSRRYWRVDCPDGAVGQCWIAAGPDATDPAP